jgi:hypothetical protein
MTELRTMFKAGQAYPECFSLSELNKIFGLYAYEVKNKKLTDKQLEMFNVLWAKIEPKFRNKWSIQ